jgi:RIO kinase 1
MVHNNKLYIIDVSQAVKLEHPNAHMFLYRDLNNINRFFSEELELRVPSTEQLFNAIVNKDYEALKKLTALEEGMEYEE